MGHKSHREPRTGQGSPDVLGNGVADPQNTATCAFLLRIAELVEGRSNINPSGS